MIKNIAKYLLVAAVFFAVISAIALVAVPSKLTVSGVLKL